MIPGSMIEPATSERIIWRRLHPQFSTSIVCHHSSVVSLVPFRDAACFPHWRTSKNRAKSLDSSIILLYSLIMMLLMSLYLYLRPSAPLAARINVAAALLRALQRRHVPQEFSLCVFQKSLPVSTLIYLLALSNCVFR